MARLKELRDMGRGSSLRDGGRSGRVYCEDEKLARLLGREKETELESGS